MESRNPTMEEERMVEMFKGLKKAENGAPSASSSSPKQSKKTPKSMVILSNRKDIYYAFHDQNQPRPIKLDTSPIVFDNESEHQIVGSCRGLLCLKVSSETSDVLWNPTENTRNFIPPLPKVEIIENRESWLYYIISGLGYSEENADFKLVRVFQFLGPEMGAAVLDTVVMVYSLKRNLWRRSLDFPHFVHSNNGRELNDVFLNGALHYIVSEKKQGTADSVHGYFSPDESDRKIAAFNVSTERYKIIPKPYEIYSNKFRANLGILSDCLCMIKHYHDNNYIRVWLMKEYGEEISWTMLFVIKRNTEVDICVRPLTFLSSSGDNEEGDEGDQQQREKVLMEADGVVFGVDLMSMSFEGVLFHGVDVKTGSKFSEICILDLDDDDEYDGGKMEQQELENFVGADEIDEFGRIQQEELQILEIVGE